MKHKVISIQKNIRIYDYLIGVFPALPSRKSIKKALKKGRVHVNGVAVSSALWVVEGMEITLIKEEKDKHTIYSVELEVIYEDDYFAIVNKPAGLISSGNQFRTLQNAVAGHLKPSMQPDSIELPLLVHRLDSPTSGLVIVAKTASAVKELGSMLAEHKIRKKYNALVIGKIEEGGKIESVINEKLAISEFKTEEQISSDAFEFLSLVELYPLTGRTHQLRLHMAQNNTAILGDRLYGNNERNIKGKGLFLSAIGLYFTHPFSKQDISIEIPLPKKFKKYWDWTVKRNAF